MVCLSMLPVLYTLMFVVMQCTASRWHNMVLVGNDLRSYDAVNVHSLRSRRDATDQPKPTMTEFDAKAVIKSQFATTTVTTVFKNSKDQNLEAAFYVQFPETAFISNFTMQIGDQMFQGVVKEKKEAQEIYDKARERNETAGIVRSHSGPEKQEGFDMFSITTALSANSTAEFVLTYQELLERKIDYVYYLYVDPQQVVPKFNLNIELDEPQGIQDRSVFGIDGRSLSFVHESSTKSTVGYSPSVADQGTGVKGMMKVKYTVKTTCDAGVFKTCSSYFIHYFSPSQKDCSLAVLNRKIYFVIDISGSMSGDKMVKTRSAMEIILKLLKPDDLFGIVLFDDAIVEWRPEVVRASTDNVNSALAYCKDNLRADGSTNIYDALKKALDRLTPLVSKDDMYAPYIIFLTDGQPNAGEFTTTQDIKREVTARNTEHIPIYSIAFGRGAGFDFLNALSHMNGGYAIKIFDGSYDSRDMSQQLQFFYSRIASPVLKNVQIIYDKTAIDTNEVTEVEVSQYFEGSDVKTVGKLQTNAPTNFQVKVVALTTTGQKEFVTDVTPTNAAYADCDIIERIYAYKWIKSLLLKATMELDESKRKTLEAEAVAMSIQYSFVTPLTSMVVVQSGIPDSSPQGGDMEVYNKAVDAGFPRSGAPGSGSMSTRYGNIVTIILFAVLPMREAW